MLLAYLQNGLGFVNGLGGVLLQIAPVVGLGCLVVAGVKLRGNGGTNFHLGGFGNWIVWALIFVSLPTLPTLMSSVLGVPGISNSFSGTSSSEFGGMENAVNTFVNTYIVQYLVPSIAGFLVVKAVLDSSEGNSPVPSLVAALFLLSVQGMYSLAKGWVGSDGYSVATGLSNALSYLSSTVCPVGASFCFIGAVVQYLKGARWGQLVLTGMAMLCATGIVALVKSWG